VVRVNIGSQEFPFAAFLLAEGDNVMEAVTEALQHLLRLAGAETGNCFVPIPSPQVRGLGAGPDGVNAVSHAFQDLCSVGRFELHLEQVAAIVAAIPLEHVEIEGLGVNGVPSDGEGAPYGSSWIFARLDGVFLDRDLGKPNGGLSGRTSGSGIGSDSGSGSRVI